MQGINGAPKGIVPSRDSAPPREELTGPGGAGGLLNTEKDAKEASTDAKFGDVWKNIQSRYGAKPEKPREIKKNLGKDDFLRIMMTQMKNQDPTNPFKAEQFATQMAQFTTVEQLQNMNNSMAKMAQGNQPLERLAMTNMIGKVVTVDKERFLHTENNASTLQYDLPRDAKEVKVIIKNAETGDVVAEKDLGPVKKGGQEFAWNGETLQGMPAKTGNYQFKVQATDQAGRQIVMQTQGQVPVVGVSFEGQEAVLLVGDNGNPQKVTLRSIIRVDSNGFAGGGGGNGLQDNGLIPGAKSLAAASAGGQAAAAPAPAARGSNYFTFEKGKGSIPVDESGLSADARAALQKYEAARAAAAADSADGKNSSTEEVEKNAEGGFPNGISSVD